MRYNINYTKYIVLRRRGGLLRLVLVISTLVTLGWWLSGFTAKALLLPRPTHHLDHFKLNRSLKSYLEESILLIKPSIEICGGDKEPSVVTVVTTLPLHFGQRQAIRDTWAKRVPVFFLMGLPGPNIDDMLVDNYIEAKEYGDIIIYSFQEDYQNLTLKTALMMKWIVESCARAKFLFKTDDDVLVNPWMLQQVIESKSDGALVGYKKLNSYFHRDEYNKWYMPRWLYRQDFVSEYLSGTGYLIRGIYIKKILETAYNVPMINLEDVYFTFLVAKLELNLNLTHDQRLSPYKPWMPGSCFYWGLALTHSLSPEEIMRVWPSLEALGKEYEKGKDVCQTYSKYIDSELVLY